MENKQLRNQVESLVQEVAKTHRYSMSRIYEAYNNVFDKDEKPQSCASCLIRKIQELEKWLAKQPPQTALPPSTAPQTEAKTPKRIAKKTNPNKH